MSGYIYGEKEPLDKCPYCGNWCQADFVDIGIGYQQCGPYHCIQCGATEIGPFDAPRELTEREADFGWYAPGSEPGSSANVVGGKVVSHKIMEAAYREEFYQNPRWIIPGEVDEWFENVRFNPHKSTQEQTCPSVTYTSNRKMKPA